MRLKLKDNWTIITLLLVINMGLISTILLFHSKEKPEEVVKNVHKTKKALMLMP